jgi:hypothetical protein
LASELEDRYQRLEEHGRALREDCEKRPIAQASAVSRRANSVGPNSKLSWGDPRFAANLVGTRRPGEEEGSPKIGHAWPPYWTGEAVCPSGTVCCSTSSSSVPWWITHARSGDPLSATMSKSCKCYNSSAFALLPTHLGTLVTGKFARIWGFRSSPTTSEHWPRVSTRS